MRKSRKIPRQKKTKKEPKSIVLSQVKLSGYQQSALTSPIPPEFVKTRKIRGGGSAPYIEVGLIIDRLNNSLSPAGWDFEILKEEILDKEVWVRGRLTLKDHKGHSVSKTQYGQKERYPGAVPLGDTLKAAASDSLKKCASMLGVALNEVYWTQIDENDKTPKEIKEEKTKQKKMTKDEAFKKALEMIPAQNSVQLLKELRIRINGSAYSVDQKQKLNRAITKKIDELEK